MQMKAFAVQQTLIKEFIRAEYKQTDPTDVWSMNLLELQYEQISPIASGLINNKELQCGKFFLALHYLLKEFFLLRLKGVVLRLER